MHCCYCSKELTTFSRVTYPFWPILKFHLPMSIAFVFIHYLRQLKTLYHYSFNRLQLSTDVKVRLRSKSGSPPLRPPTVTSSRGQPISLPPIFGISGSPNHATASSASTSGYFSLTTPSSRLGSSTLSTPRSLRFDSGKVNLPVPK